MQRAVTALRVYGSLHDILGLALVLLRQLCDGGLEVLDFVDAGEVEHVVDLICCERGGCCGSHDCDMIRKSVGILIVYMVPICLRKFCGTCVTFFRTHHSAGSFAPILRAEDYA